MGGGDLRHPRRGDEVELEALVLEEAASRATRTGRSCTAFMIATCGFFFAIPGFPAASLTLMGLS